MNEKYNVSQRHAIEKKFHDKWASKIKDKDVNFEGAFGATTALENKFALKSFGNIKNKKILDLGCGMGDASLYFASQGAYVTSVDISPGMIKVVKKLSKKMNFKNINAKVMLAEKLKFSDRSFDLVFGNGVLHHVYTDLALREVHRVLKKGGTAAFIEPLQHNPIINVYRRIADKVRTPTETPIDYNNINKLTDAPFSKFIHDEFHLCTLVIFLWYFLVDKVNPNKARYWKKIINDSSKIEVPFNFLNKIDQFIKKYFSSLRRYYWNTVLIFKK